MTQVASHVRFLIPAVVVGALAISPVRPAEPSDADERVFVGQFERAEPLSAEETALTIGIDTDVPRTTLDSDTFWAPLCAALGIAGWLAGPRTVAGTQPALPSRRGAFR